MSVGSGLSTGGGSSRRGAAGRGAGGAARAGWSTRVVVGMGGWILSAVAAVSGWGTVAAVAAGRAVRGRGGEGWGALKGRTEGVGGRGSAIGVVSVKPSIVQCVVCAAVMWAGVLELLLSCPKLVGALGGILMCGGLGWSTARRAPGPSGRSGEFTCVVVFWVGVVGFLLFCPEVAGALGSVLARSMGVGGLFGGSFSTRALDPGVSGIVTKAGEWGVAVSGGGVGGGGVAGGVWGAAGLLWKKESMLLVGSLSFLLLLLCLLFTLIIVFFFFLFFWAWTPNGAVSLIVGRSGCQSLNTLMLLMSCSSVLRVSGISSSSLRRLGGGSRTGGRCALVRSR